MASSSEYGWKLYPHLEVLTNALQAVERGEIKRLIVSMPPQHGKSETISRFFPAWYLGRNPRNSVILTAYEANFAAEWGGKVRDVLEEFGEEVFGVSVSRRSRANDRWTLNRTKGGMRTAGARGPLTGKGANLIIIDDPVKNDEEACSETYREKTWNWYRATVRSRIRKGTAIVILMTRWHEDDLAGKLIAAGDSGEGEKWTVINFPAIAEGPEDWSEWGVDHQREFGDPLCPELHDAEELEATRKASGSFWWEALYQGQPSPDEGDIYKRYWWRYWHPEKSPLPYRFDEVLMSWDMAFKDKRTSSFVVGQVWGRSGSNYYLLDQVRDQLSFPKTVKAVEALIHAWPEATRRLIEDKANGPAVIDTLGKKFSGLIPVTPDQSKLARARAVSAIAESMNVYLPDPSARTRCGGSGWVNGWIDEHASFPNAKHDDQVDCQTQAIRYMEAKRLSKSGPLVAPRSTQYSRMIV